MTCCAACKRHRLQFVGGGLQDIHFFGGEFVERRFVPIGLLAGVPGEPGLFHLLLPVRRVALPSILRIYSPAPTVTRTRRSESAARHAW